MKEIWLILTVALAVLEAATVQLVSLWFACGALCAMAASFFTDSIMAQSIVFVVCSVLFLLIARRYVKRLTENKTATNTDMLIGKTAILKEATDDMVTGTLSVNGLIWTALSEGGRIEAGERVRIVKIDGVKLIVRKED